MLLLLELLACDLWLLSPHRFSPKQLSSILTCKRKLTFKHRVIKLADKLRENGVGFIFFSLESVGKKTAMSDLEKKLIQDTKAGRIVSLERGLLIISGLKTEGEIVEQNI